MKIANVKGMVAKGMMVVLAAGALMIASPAKAQAEVVVGFGFRAPTPVVVQAYPRYDRFAFERRQAFLQHEEWLRMHRFDRSYGYR
jgi:hypothetical protein